MIIRKGIVVVIVRRERKDFSFLIIKNRESRNWELVKGGLMDNNENFEHAVRRETKEEVGINLVKIIPLKEKLEYNFGTEYASTLGDKASYEAFIGIVDENSKIELEKNFTDFKWLKLEEALVEIKFTEQKNILIKTSSFLKNQKIL
jgi:8-oxo-dGTP pyrophosphatase MutT (NUDIX family)